MDNSRSFNPRRPLARTPLSPVVDGFCVCALCGLVATVQHPAFAGDPAPATAPASSASATFMLESTKSNASPRTSAVKSDAKSQLTKLQSTPLHLLKTSAAEAPFRFSLTSQSATQVFYPQRSPHQSFVAPVAATTLITSSPQARLAMATAPSASMSEDKSDNNAGAEEEHHVRLAAAESESQPMTGTVDFSKRESEPASEPVVEEVAESDTAGEAVPSIVPPSDEATTPAAQSRLYATSITYEGGVIIAEGTPDSPVRLESSDNKIFAQRVRLDTVNRIVRAEGTVRVEREVTARRFTAFSPTGIDDEVDETITETLTGENFEYNYGTREGTLGATRIRLANFNISAEELVINGRRYVARNVVVRPGGLSDEELRIYGTPPFNIRARELIVDASQPAPTGGTVADTAEQEQNVQNPGVQTQVRGASLYFRNLRLLPIPSALLRRNFGPREERTFQLTPRVYTNSADGILLTVGMDYPLNRQNPDLLSLGADIGFSARVGFRGGAAVESNNRLGRFALGARINDVVSAQLTERIELDRLPEAFYAPPRLELFRLPGNRMAGLRFAFVAGDYRERFTNASRDVRSSRLQGLVRFTTRMGKETGPYLDLLARTARYSDHHEDLTTTGFEVGYIGRLTSRISGQFSYGATNVSGSTPFRFDEVEIQKELRATFDILVTPRYIVPIDLRYDVQKGKLVDKTFGLLRNYKTFAYGVTYQSARKELKLEIRSGF